MATAGKKSSASKGAAKKKPARGVPGKRSAGVPRTPGAPNQIVQLSDGLYVRSGVTGAVRKLTTAEAAAVSDLLAQRQALGEQLAECLANKGFTLSNDIIWDSPPW